MSAIRAASSKFINLGLLRGTRRFFCTENVDQKGGFAKAYDTFQTLVKTQPEIKSFPALLKNSSFIDLGDPEGKVVQGRILYVIKDDLYIDFGWKFHCVCTRPRKQYESYVRGAKVRLRIKDLELSSRFLGYDKDLTLLEADCTLLGLVQERPNSNDAT